ncbi:MAG: hypothetical protein II776_07860, partial [Clostridia bacterium]|nr:hypothetical protein [Clostridia bacterium]
SPAPGNTAFKRADSEFSFPYGFKHGRFLEITQEEYRRLKQASAGDGVQLAVEMVKSGVSDRCDHQENHQNDQQHLAQGASFFPGLFPVMGSFLTHDKKDPFQGFCTMYLSILSHRRCFCNSGGSFEADPVPGLRQFTFCFFGR